MGVHDSNAKTRTPQQTCYSCGGSLEVRADVVNIYNQIIRLCCGTMIDAAIEKGLGAGQDWPPSSYVGADLCPIFRPLNDRNVKDTPIEFC